MDRPARNVRIRYERTFDMTHPSCLREQARRLRAEKRLTIDELAERLALSRSTVYDLVRDMPIPGSGPGTGFSSEGQRKGTRAMKRKYRLLREAAYREGVESFPGLVAEPTFREFVCLYIAEGYKRSRQTVSICNSDPSVMVLSDRWIRRLTGVLAISSHDTYFRTRLGAWIDLVKADWAEFTG